MIFLKWNSKEAQQRNCLHHSLPPIKRKKWIEKKLSDAIRTFNQLNISHNLCIVAAPSSLLQQHEFISGNGQCLMLLHCRLMYFFLTHSLPTFAHPFILHMQSFALGKKESKEEKKPFVYIINDSDWEKCWHRWYFVHVSVCFNVVHFTIIWKPLNNRKHFTKNAYCEHQSVFPPVMMPQFLVSGESGRSRFFTGHSISVNFCPFLDYWLLWHKNKSRINNKYSR